MTVAAASAQVAAMVEEWESPPDIVEPPLPEAPEAPAPEVPDRPEVAETPPPPDVAQPSMPAVPVMADLPDVPSLPPIPEEREVEPEPEQEPEDVAEAEPEPEQEPEPEKETEAEPEPEPLTALAEAERPASRPEQVAALAPPPEPQPDPEPQPERAPPPPQEARPELRATGSGGGPTQGGRGTAAVATGSSGQQADMIAVWGAQIQQRLQRALVYPRQAEMRRITGVATVALTVGSDGRVQARQLVGSSGSPILDEAALSTVDRTSGIPPAPQALGSGSFTFQLPVRFDGR